RLEGNPTCSKSSLIEFCGPHQQVFNTNVNITNLTSCPPQACPPPYEYAPPSPLISCFCAAPIVIGYRLKSPGFSDFRPYVFSFLKYICSSMNLHLYQLEIASASWQEGPRLRMNLKIFPDSVDDTVRLLNKSDVLRILGMFSSWKFPGNPVFGPYDLLSFTLTEPYLDELPPSSSSLSKAAFAGIILGSIAGAFTVTAAVFIFILMKISTVKNFRFSEISNATKSFDSSSVVGEGGYGKVYRGVLSDGTIVAIKRAKKGSLQGENEFLTEIDLLSRCHHRNLVSLFGYCDEEDEQMLIYEFMSNGTLRDHLSGNRLLNFFYDLKHADDNFVVVAERCKMPLPFAMRIKIALGAARGILYLHTEANPPIFHRDIKSTNILLDSNFTAKVADFGLSRLAPFSELEEGNAVVSTVVKGTPGYVDPEYFLTSKLTDRSDVYSLGVVFLEMLTGMHPIFHGKNIVREV
ncbi:hypothetical protein M569_07912, partial [Genlisea aurea]